jgi:tetratricopeptide (TPR) repeat protein
MVGLHEARRRHALYYQGVLRGADRLYADGGAAAQRGIHILQSEWANIRAGQEWAAGYAESDLEAAASCSYYASAGAHLIKLIINPRERILWFQAGLSAAARLKDRRAESRHSNQLGLAYAAVDELQRAMELYEKSLTVCREIGNRRGEGVALGNLGGAYFAAGDLDRAADVYQQRLAIVREVGDRRGEGSALGNLGVIYKKMGEVRRAIYCRSALVKTMHFSARL